ncbi:MAG: hypothetical protein DCF12_16145 [Snowella sp.]|jgi:hypothetical protein|nr:MAG: hypothetical protein DCF12_16145 [Snowella sp.]
MLRSHELTITHILFMDEGQVIKKELQERFGNFNAARNAYKETYGITAGGWDTLVAKVQNLSIPIPIKERVQTLEGTVKVLSETLQQLEAKVTTKSEAECPMSNHVNFLSETLQRLEESINVLSETLRQSLDRGEIIQKSEKPVKKISSYEEFKEVVLEVYERLNYDYNYNSFVPIYVIRRDIGERVTRSQFKEWMLKIRLERILSFYICDNRTLTQEEIQDSIYDDNLGTQYFFTQKN